MPTCKPTPTAASCETVFAGIHTSLFALATSDLSAADAAALGIVDRDVGVLGFRRLGDLLCSTMPEAVIRCYGRDDTDYCGFHVRKRTGESYTEFYTEFADGSSMTTSTNPESVSYPLVRIFRRVAAVEDTGLLEIAHRAAIAEHSLARGTRAIRARPDLTSCAAMIERFLDRYIRLIASAG